MILKDGADLLDVVPTIPEPMRHYYKGLLDAFSYVTPVDVDMNTEQLDMVYSPTGGNMPAPSFYGEWRLADDNVTHKFNPLHFLAMAAELDSEAGLLYINVTPTPPHWLEPVGHRTTWLNANEGYLHFTIRCTEESDASLAPPDNMLWRNANDWAADGTYIPTTDKETS